MNSNMKTMIIAAIMIVAVAAAVVIPSEDSDAQGLEITEVDTTTIPGYVFITLNESVSSATVTISTADDSITAKPTLENPSNILGVECDIELNEGDFTVTVVTANGTATYPAETPGMEYCTITINQPANGTIAVTGADDLDAVEAGTELTATVTPAKGYEIQGPASWTVTVNADLEISLPEGTTIVEVETPVDPEEDPADRPFSNTITLGDGAVIDASSSIHASDSQEVIIAGDVTVAADGELTILGKLTIQEGASLNVDNGGKVAVSGNGIVDVQGDLYVEGATSGYSFTYGGIVMTVSGNVYLEGANSFDSTGKGIEVSGIFEVGDEASANLNGAKVVAGGELVIYGVVTGTVENAGTITVDSQGFENGTTVVDMVVDMKADATVDIVNLYGKIVVSDENLTFDATKALKDQAAANDNVVTLTNVAGVTVTETIVVSEKDKVYTGTNTMYVSGTVTYAVDYNGLNEAGSIGIAVAGENGNVEIAEDVVLTEGVTMTVDGVLKVSANLTATAEETGISGAGEMTVTGKVTVDGKADVATINAARYSTTGTTPYTVYTTLETALTDAAAQINLMGENSVAADATIPVGTTVTMETGSVLTIEDPAVLTVAADDRKSAKLITQGNDVNVEGTLVVTDMAKSRVTDADVNSDTAKEVEDAKTYTNIYNALANAADGEVVEITQPVELKQSIEIGAGVTLYVPATQSMNVPNDVTVTVNGTLYVLGGYTMAPADDTAEPKKAAGATVVNGMFLTDDSSEYVGTIVGAYFDYAYNFDRKDVTVEAVAPLASVPAIVDDVMSAEIVLNGDMTLGAIDFSAYAGEDELTIVVADSVTFENLTLGSVVLSTVGADSVSGTVTLANGTVVLDNVNGIIAQNVTDPVEETVTSEIDGTVYAYDDAETEAVEKGSVSATGEIVSSIGTVENVAFDVPAGATVTAEAGIFYGAVTVEGDLVISGTAISFQSLSVTGTVTAEDDNSATAVKLYIGVTAEDMAMAGTGSVDGVTLAKTPGSVAYVSPNATVGEVFADLNSTAYYVEDALYLTAYAANADVAINDVQFKVDDARFDGWMYTDKDDKAQEVTGAMNVGEPAEVYADIEYNIYNVTITADAGIGSVAVDGNVLANAGGNQFHINGLAAGQHTISYTLKSGYQGEATLTVKGENATVSGLDFTLSGNPEGTAQTVSVELSLAGTEPGQTTVVVDGGDSGMGLTDYLLIILVVLIVVMAIIVALRMMRS